jgi:hypothetical protein
MTIGRKSQPLSLLDHAELAVELAHMEALLSNWLCEGGIVSAKLGTTHPVTLGIAEVRRKIWSLRSQLDDLWCEQTPRDSGFPNYSPSVRKALVEVTGYREPRCLRTLLENMDTQEYEKVRAALAALFRAQK